MLAKIRGQQFDLHPLMSNVCQDMSLTLKYLLHESSPPQYLLPPHITSSHFLRSHSRLLPLRLKTRHDDPFIFLEDLVQLTLVVHVPLPHLFKDLLGDLPEVNTVNMSMESLAPLSTCKWALLTGAMHGHRTGEKHIELKPPTFPIFGSGELETHIGIMQLPQQNIHPASGWISCGVLWRSLPATRRGHWQ